MSALKPLSWLAVILALSGVGYTLYNAGYDKGYTDVTNKFLIKESELNDKKAKIRASPPDIDHIASQLRKGQF